MTAVNSEKALENGEKNNAPEVPDENDKDSENESQVDDKELKSDSKEAEKNEQTQRERVLQHLYKDPSFAIICSFFNRFGNLLGLKPQSFARTEQLLTSFHETGREIILFSVDRDLIDLHLTLLRKLNFKSARAPVWEKFLLKFCSLTASLGSEFLQLERFGYLNTPPATKLAVLKALCEAQFDFNLKFKETVSSIRGAANFRLLPVGSDYHGLAYWYQQDSYLNIRVYTEEPDDHSGNSWSLVAKSKEELETLLDKLKAFCKEKDISKFTPRSEVLRKAEDEKVNKGPYGFEVGTRKGDILDLFKEDFLLAKVNHKEEKAEKNRKKNFSVEKGEKEVAESVEELENAIEDLTDRRVLPRRSAKNAAINHLKELTSPTKKVANKESGKKKGRSSRNVKPTKSEECSPVRENNASGCDGDEPDDAGEDYTLFEDDEDSDEPSSDDDFMPLSEIKKRGKRNRKGKGKKGDHDVYEMEDYEQEEDDDSEEEIKKERKQATVETLCKNCQKSSNPEVLLLCDMCDDAWHTWCLHPMLWYVPNGDWFCPRCHHLMLIDKFASIVATLSEQLKQKIAEDKRKEAAAERLKREMDYIGISVNNIIPLNSSPKTEDNSDVSEESTDTDDGERKSKKRAIRRLGVRPERPIIPIALGRSRRHVAKVDYNFGAYDELIREAMENIDASATKQKMSKDPIRPQGGAGRGKDMSNILNAEQKRQSSVDTSAGEERLRKSCTRKTPKSHHRLNDLDVDEMTESESDEYKASEDGSEASDVPSDDFDEYVPSDEAPRRRSNRRRRSDDDFVVSGSESDYSPSAKRSRRARFSERVSSDDDSTSEESYYCSSDDSAAGKKKRRSSVGNKWAPPASSSDEGSEYNMKSNTGRPLRKAVYKKKMIQKEESEEEDEEDSEQESHTSQSNRKKRNSDEAFSPDEDEEEEEEDEEDEEEEEEDDDDDNDGEEEEEEEHDSGVKSNTTEEAEKKIQAKNDEKDDVASSSKKTVEEKKIEEHDEEKEGSSTTEKDVSQKQQPFIQQECENKGLKSPPGPAAELPAVKNATGRKPQSSFVPFKREVDTDFPSTSRPVLETPPAQLHYSVPSKVTGPMENPSVVMQQMAQLAAATPMSHYIPIVNPSQAMTAPPPFPNALGGFLPEKIPYPGPPPAAYTVHPLGFARIPTAVPSPIRPSVPPEAWQPCSLPHNVFAPPPIRVSSSPVQPRNRPPPSQNPSDPDSLGNALASAMDY
ncbi:unnamed protein product [Enterobius vermicularis]|uniref:PHD-type domain-containing protein n=1 Tax=Enterobius vermicularis TaxID=51028 RepID=A0A0N4V6B7_ENTVE|nr:unnamed protein product [Enterobius vermicularis]